MAGVEVLNRECWACGSSRLVFFSHELDRMRVVCTRPPFVEALPCTPEEDAFVWRPDQPRHGEFDACPS